LIINPELQVLPDYPSQALKLLKTETDSILCEFNRIFDTKDQESLEIQNDWNNESRPNRRQCLPQLPCYAKVDIRQRVAPLLLKFVFFDLHSGEQIKSPDTVICLHATDPRPTIEKNARLVEKRGATIKTTYCDFASAGKVWPEVNPETKQPVPQQVYISMTSQSGCSCDVYASFPRERPNKTFKQRLLELKKNAGTVSLTERLHFPELEKVREVKKFVKTEIDEAWNDETYYP
jgi:hypothetical protein